MTLFIGLALFLGMQATMAKTPSFDVHDKASVQRGAELFMNYCSGCHSLKYLRYKHIDEGVLKNNLIYTQATINEPIQIAMPAEDAQQWFGKVPPDLSLIAREKGTEWLYSYLNSFYNDNSRPFGVNNRVVPSVAMPDVLISLTGGLTHEQAETTLQDLVTFLEYVGDPSQSIRHRLGLFVLAFLFVFLLVVLSLKRLYWRKLGPNQPKRLKMW